MMSQQSSEAIEVPEELTSASAKLVYLYLDSQGAATVPELHAALGVERLTLYSVLRTLHDRGVLARDEERYRTTA